FFPVSHLILYPARITETYSTGKWSPWRLSFYLLFLLVLAEAFACIHWFIVSGKFANNSVSSLHYRQRNAWKWLAGCQPPHCRSSTACPPPIKIGRASCRARVDGL